MGRDNYQEITDRIASALEDFAAGRRAAPPWVRPWDARGAGAPHNGHSGHVYRGVNLLLVWAAGYADARWYTFNQVAKNYGVSHVRKGERGTQVVFFQMIEKKKRAADGAEKTDRIPLLRVYTIFNHQQIAWEAGHEPQAEATTATAIDPQAVHAEALALLARAGAKVEHGGDRAFYGPALDAIRMPPVASFATEAGYVAVLAHEHVHWTGHPSRCARNLSGRFGSSSYAAEELVAELGAAFLCADFGLGTILDEQHTAYVADWIQVLRSDKYAIFTAARLARDAVAFLRGEKAGDEAATEAA